MSKILERQMIIDLVEWLEIDMRYNLSEPKDDEYYNDICEILLKQDDIVLCGMLNKEYGYQIQAGPYKFQKSGTFDVHFQKNGGGKGCATTEDKNEAIILAAYRTMKWELEHAK